MLVKVNREVFHRYSVLKAQVDVKKFFDSLSLSLSHTHARARAQKIPWSSLQNICICILELRASDICRYII